MLGQQNRGNRAAAARWKEEEENPTPIRSRQRCYSCKVPWEPDHRCRGKGKKHIIEVHYDSDDEVCEDTEQELDAYLEQSDDASDSCTKASDSSTLEEDSDPCTLEDSGMDTMIAPVLQQSYHHVLMTLHFNRGMTLVEIHTCQHLEMTSSLG
jgi:hypothetical protein